MKEIPINLTSLIVATVVKFVIGALWYSPLLFGKAWAKATGCSDEKMKSGMGKKIAADAVAGFVMAFVLLHAVVYAGADTFLKGMAVGFFNWLGLVAVATLGIVTWEGKPFSLYAIINGYFVVALMIMGGILAVWH